MNNQEHGTNQEGTMEVLSCTDMGTQRFTNMTVAGKDSWVYQWMPLRLKDVLRDIEVEIMGPVDVSPESKASIVLRANMKLYQIVNIE